jgi:hypothetical protein
MAIYNIYCICLALVDTEVKVSDEMNEFLNLEGSDTFETDTRIF